MSHSVTTSGLQKILSWAGRFFY